MANVYVRSGAAGAGTGADWTNAYTTLSAALTAKAAGDDFWVSEDHAESTAGAVTLTAPGTVASPNRIICVNHAGSVPPVSADLATTATITTTGANAITLGAGHSYVYGITFNNGSGAVNAIMIIGASATSTWNMEKCNINLVATGSGMELQLGVATNSTLINWKNVAVKFANAAQYIEVREACLHWYGSLSKVDSAGTAPTSLFVSGANNRLYTPVLIEDVDLSFLGSGKTIVAASQRAPFVTLRNCKLGASVTKATAPTVPGGRVRFVRCDSGAVNYSNDEFAYEGTLSTETTIVRTNGQSDGTQAVSQKIVTTANSKWQQPFTISAATIWNDTVGSSITVTLEGIWGGGAVPNNDDIWLEVDYLSSSSTPQGAIATCGKADALATAAALTSSSAAWGGSTTAFNMAVTFTPQMKGPLNFIVKAAKASSTFYIDQKPTISGVTVGKTYFADYSTVNEIASGGGVIGG